IARAPFAARPKSEGWNMPKSPSATDQNRPVPEANGVPAPPDELTEAEAADLLCVSLPYLSRLLDEGQITSRTVGTARRLHRADVLIYKTLSLERSRKAMEELAAQAQDLKMGY